MSERPAKYEVGQRWSWGSSDAWSDITLVEYQERHGTWRARTPRGAIGSFDAHMMAQARYLGPSPQGVRAGQRWKSSHGDVSTVHSVYLGNECGAKFHDKPHVHWDAAGVDWDGIYNGAPCFGGSTLLPDTSPGEAETRERLLRELHEARARTVAVVGNAATARIPATPCLRCGRMECICARREVSPDGKAWINYDRLTDGDSFEAYRFRRLDGVVVAMEEAPRGIVHPMSCHCGRPAGFGWRYENCEKHAADCERETAGLMDHNGMRRGPDDEQPSKPQTIPQCHPTSWGGCINIRGGR